MRNCNANILTERFKIRDISLPLSIYDSTFNEERRSLRPSILLNTTIVPVMSTPCASYYVNAAAEDHHIYEDLKVGQPLPPQVFYLGSPNLQVTN